MTFEIQLGPQGFVGKVKIEGDVGTEILLPQVWEEGRKVACCLTYEHSAKTLYITGVEHPQIKVMCDLGYVGAEDFDKVSWDHAFDAHVFHQMVHIHSRAFDVEEIRMLSEDVDRLIRTQVDVGRRD